jgi:hypothetical protein
LSEEDRVSGTVVRGFAAPVKYDLPLAEAVLSGKATLADILKLYPLDRKRVGIWWYLVGYEDPDPWSFEDTVEEAKSFAYSEGKEETIATSFGQELLEELRLGKSWSGRKVTRIGLDLPLVLIAKAPPGWSPDLNPPGAYGLMGNSYIDPKHAKALELERVMYLSGKGWKTLSAKGLRVKL